MVRFAGACRAVDGDDGLQTRWPGRAFGHARLLLRLGLATRGCGASVRLA